ncbi:hypothetical protein CDOO_01065 [Corynebacterium doosanense CAU 212 = DSM 45436]|uniref:Uncharacterized protein n=1 Tax=Corynebacterium doosanense CAU 212 = DSM 45436 TaxID=558173 RepID=A0A097IJ28_9CORY|nr:hypothetical protein [Corynebacterium doosanense]AIT62147.1 hypothetical protein CDOO_01065 [Corynebacterium doosanense CAU 212 = DSM 45436]
MVVSRILRPILGQGQRVHQTGDGPLTPGNSKYPDLPEPPVVDFDWEYDEDILADYISKIGTTVLLQSSGDRKTCVK